MEYMRRKKDVRGCEGGDIAQKLLVIFMNVMNAHESRFVNDRNK